MYKLKDLYVCINENNKQTKFVKKNTKTWNVDIAHQKRAQRIKKETKKRFQLRMKEARS